MNKDIVIVGGGLSALFVLKQISDKQVSVLLIEAYDAIGGTFNILKDNETSFDFNDEKLDFPSLLNSINKLSSSSDIDIWTQSYVRNITRENDAFYLDVITRDGIKNVRAKQVVMATGYRERTINQAFIEGDRKSVV